VLSLSSNSSGIGSLLKGRPRTRVDFPDEIAAEFTDSQLNSIGHFGSGHGNDDFLAAIVNLGAIRTSVLITIYCRRRMKEILLIALVSRETFA
jgi:hypothetical protein